MPPYSYVIAVDFEATCGEGIDKPEIIEFAAVLMNLRTGQIAATFHKYIKPTENPVLTTFCKNLTGITQHEVDSGIRLDAALKKFEEWVYDLRTQNVFIDTNCAFVTWTDNDLKIILPRELSRKVWKKPVCLNKWIDLSSVYQRVYGGTPKTLENALKDIGLRYEGRPHSGLDDAKNLAKLAYKMEQRVTLSITSAI